MQQHKKIAILGFGKEGKSALRFLKKSRGYKNAAIDLLDKKLNKNYLDRLADYDLIVKSPGIPWHAPEITKALRKGTRFTTPTSLFFEHAKGTIIGITGTKGKGTTATLLYRMLEARRNDIFLAGNIGKPMLDVLPKLQKNSLVILELSSFQLERLSYSPHIAVIVDIFPDHLNHHRNVREYINAKYFITKNQTPRDHLFFLTHNRRVKQIARKSKAKKHAVDIKKFTLFRQNDLRLLGQHNFANAAMAAAIARHLDVSQTIIKKVASSFRGNPHRLEFVARKRGITFYNDSAATIPQATIAAIQSFKQPILLITGGASKNLNDKPLIRALAAAPNIKKVFANMALREAFTEAVKKAEKGDVILLSPGAASFDQFRNYEERGNAFKDLVKKL